MDKFFIILGVISVIIGIFLYIFKGFPFFKLPGDIVIQKENFTFYFPITSSVLLSIVLTLLFTFISKFFK